MSIEYTTDGEVSPEEMQVLAESVGFGPHRTLERNGAALSGSTFVATARHDGRLVALVRLVGDGAYILHVAELTVHPDSQGKGVGRRLMQMAIAFANASGVGTGENLGEFTLFANAGADTFYEKLGFSLAPNGMVLTDTQSRKNYELNFQKEWKRERTQR